MTQMEQEVAKLQFEVGALKTALAVLTCSIYGSPEQIKSLGDFCRVAEATSRSTGSENVARINQHLFDQNAEMYRLAALIFDTTERMRERIDTAEPRPEADQHSA